MSENLRIRVCLGCRKYIIINETYEEKKKLIKFEANHAKHLLVTAAYNEKDNLECGKEHCEDTDVRKKLVYEM